MNVLQTVITVTLRNGFDSADSSDAGTQSCAEESWSGIRIPHRESALRAADRNPGRPLQNKGTYRKVAEIISYLVLPRVQIQKTTVLFQQPQRNTVLNRKRIT